ncbi:GNAT family N-acetyltransferase [Rhodobacterales bacterium HKCCE2091]|nr:GNAT family N-acetyltransferase [Rhodobacterales bacterium HKCCE2091]
MRELVRGRLRARAASDEADLRAAQALRQQAFRGSEGLDADAFDAACDHVLIEATAGGPPVACFRLMHFDGGAEVRASYAAQVYDLSELSALPGPMMEMGRFCIRPGLADPDILRLAWGALAGEVDRRGVAMLFGCVSFRGTDPAPYADAFAMLGARHLAPPRWRPGVGGRDIVPLEPGTGGLDERRAMTQMPPLLRSYLAMGGRVSDHAVIDRDLGTLHVFTGLDIAEVPPNRARALRALAG